MRARSLAMPSSVMRPCSVSAMGPPWAGPRARPEQPDDRLFEEAALDGERARREEVVAPAGQAAERGGVGEIREDHAEEGDAEMRDLLRLPAGVERLLAGDVIVEAGGGHPHLAREVAYRHALHPVRREQPLGGVEDDLAGGGGGSAVTGPPLDGSAGHGGGVTNERSLRQGARL